MGKSNKTYLNDQNYFYINIRYISKSNYFVINENCLQQRKKPHITIVLNNKNKYYKENHITISYYQLKRFVFQKKMSKFAP